LIKILYSCLGKLFDWLFLMNVVMMPVKNSLIVWTTYESSEIIPKNSGHVGWASIGAVLLIRIIWLHRFCNIFLSIFKSGLHSSSYMIHLLLLLLTLSSLWECHTNSFTMIFLLSQLFFLFVQFIWRIRINTCTSGFVISDRNCLL